MAIHNKNPGCAFSIQFIIFIFELKRIISFTVFLIDQNYQYKIGKILCGEMSVLVGAMVLAHVTLARVTLARVTLARILVIIANLPAVSTCPRPY
jgi:hypothetical protein